MSEDFLTVSQLNQRIKDVIQMRFGSEMWVCGEIQGFRQARSGHIYFDLVEKEEGTSKITAKITAALFANRRFHIENILKKSQNAFTLKNDIEVKFAGQVNFYEPYGTISFIVQDIDPTYTLGRLAQEKARLIAELTKKGILEKNKQLPFPLVPLKIGLITSHDSAAYNDFTKEIERSGYGFQILIRNTLMQGKKAEQDVVAAIDELEAQAGIDVIVISRGGGSKADLSDFDSKIIAERIARSSVPVFSGIGHEIDLSVTDLAAHTYAKTPTAIAQVLVDRVETFCLRLDDALQHVRQFADEKLTYEKQRIKEKAYALQEKTMSFLQSHRHKMLTLSEALKHKPFQHFKESKQRLHNQFDHLERAIRIRFKQEQAQLQNYERTIDLVHPRNTLKRGFSITRDQEGKAVRDMGTVQADDEITTEIFEGVFTSLIKTIKKVK